LLDTTQGSNDRVEQEQQDVGAVMIEEQPTIASPVALGAHRMQAFQQRHQPVKVLQANDVTLVGC
jgi:hypothetical protein